MNRDRISTQAGMCGWLAYSPPKELGQGREVTSYGPGGFAIWTSSGPSSNTAPRQLRTVLPLSFEAARVVADQVDQWLAFEARPGRLVSCRSWVEAVIADLPTALQEAIEVAGERVTELRVMRAAATGDTT